MWPCASANRPRGFDRKRFEIEIGYIVDDLLDRPVEQIDTVELGNAIIAVIRNHHLNIPSNYIIFMKTVAMLEGTSRSLDTSFNLAELLMPYVQDIARRRFSLQSLMQSLLRSYRDWDRLIHALPALLSDILNQAQSGEFSVQLQINRLDRITNRLIFGMADQFRLHQAQARGLRSLCQASFFHPDRCLSTSEPAPTGQNHQTSGYKYPPAYRAAPPQHHALSAR